MACLPDRPWQRRMGWAIWDMAQFTPRPTRLPRLQGCASVIRFWNNEIIENSEGVLQPILEALNTCPPHLASGRGVGATPLA